MVTTAAEKEQACRIAVIQAWTQDPSGEVRCRVVKSDNGEDDLESISIVGVGDVMAWLEEWLSEYRNG